MSGRRPPRAVRASARVYRLLLYAYPSRFRRRYGVEMARLFRDCCRDAERERGAWGVLRLWPGALGDLVRTAALEWAAGLRRPATATGRYAACETGRRLGMGGRLRRLRRGVSVLLRGRAYPVLAGENMRDRFEKFTERARRTLAFSADEARALGHSHIGTEHLLLGLLDEGGGVAARALRNLGVEPERVRGRVGFIIGQRAAPAAGEIGLTPRSKRIVELAVDEARRMGHHYVGTEHLLLGMIREGEGIGAGVLAEMGVQLEAARAETLRVLREREH
jgi:hypothetical protein